MKYKILLYTAGLMLVLYLFYRSIWVLTLLLPCMVVCRRFLSKEEMMKRKAELASQFKELLESLVASLRAGYSIQNALRESRKDMKTIHGEDSPIYQENCFMVNQLEMGMTPEDIFFAFAEKWKIEDLETFASVFSIAVRGGGDLVEILMKTSADIGSKIDTRKEIGVVISAKKLEMNIMSLIPMGIIVYMELATDGMLDPLYGNVRGVVIMTCCLLLYAGAVLLGRKMTNIEV